MTINARMANYQVVDGLIEAKKLNPCCKDLIRRLVQRGGSAKIERKTFESMTDTNSLSQPLTVVLVKWKDGKMHLTQEAKQLMGIS